MSFTAFGYFRRGKSRVNACNVSSRNLLQYHFVLFCFSITQRADLSTSPLTINSERLQVLEFSKPFMQFTMSLISKKVDLNDHDLTTFMLPYSTTVWLVTLACLLFVTVLMYLVNFFSPYGHRSRHKHHGETGEEFDFHNSLWFCLASMLQQGADHTPKSFSGRLLEGVTSQMIENLSVNR